MAKLSVDSEKKRLREELKKTLEALDAEYIEASDRKIFEAVIALPEFRRAGCVFLYYSVGREADTRRLMDYCERENIPYALPRVYGSGKMDFCLVDGKSPLVSKPPYGIPEPPENAEPLVPKPGDIVLVPALAFDADGYRLGYGGGYYDRFLAKHPAYSIGLCRRRLGFFVLPRESHDLPVNRVISD